VISVFVVQNNEGRTHDDRFWELRIRWHNTRTLDGVSISSVKEFSFSSFISDQFILLIHWECCWFLFKIWMNILTILNIIWFQNFDNKYWHQDRFRKMDRIHLMNWPHLSYLPGIEVNHDQEGGSSRARHTHCTTVKLTSVISPNAGNSDAKFILWGLRSRYPL
jgi:hypothetical protein